MSGELVCSYAALILHDAGKDITEAAITKVVEAAKCKTEPYWPMLYASILKDKDAVDEIIYKPGGSGGAAQGGSSGGDAGEEEKEEEKEEEEEEEEEVAMGGLMGGDDDGW